MENAIQEYITYLHDVKKTSYNTEISYKRDLKKAAAFFKEQDITDPADITVTSVNSYLLYLEKDHMSTATVSRNIASLRSFFRFLQKEHRISQDPSESIKPPKVEKKQSDVLTVEEVRTLLSQPNTATDKGMRDKAMLELLYSTGIRVSELVHLKLGDLNQELGYITCRESGKERTVPFGKETGKAVAAYLDSARGRLLKGKESEFLFSNCSGPPMSRQGFWKVLKSYAQKAGIEKDITPHTMRRSFATHMLQSGESIYDLQRILGHADVATTQLCAVQPQN